MNISKRHIYTVSALTVLIVAEFLFDYAEIALGSVIELTNGMRSQSGAVWDRTLAREHAAEKLGILGRREEEDRVAVREAAMFGEVLDLLGSRETIVLDKDAFMGFYRTMTRRQALAVIPPLTLLDIDLGGAFRRCYLKNEGETAAVIFLDDMNQPVFRSQADKALFTGPSGTAGIVSREHGLFLNSDAKIVGRDLFLQAFNALESDERKSQIVNDPYRLIVWGERLQRIAILPETAFGTVPVVCEVRSGADMTYIEFSARPQAVEYLKPIIKDIEEQQVNPIRER